MFEASCPSALLDYFRMPYAVSGNGGRLESIRPLAGERALLWPRDGAWSADAPRHGFLGPIAIFGRLLPDAAARALLGRGWEEWLPILEPGGERVASVWRSEAGSVFLPFDPDDVMRAYWSESYRDVTVGPGSRRATVAGRRAYYAARPLLPKRVQLGLRRLFSLVQARTRFPAWPMETSLHDLYDLLLGQLAELAGEPVPVLAPWPEGRAWALVLTHDVETSAGYRDLAGLRGLESEHGYRSSWNFVPLRYEVDDGLVRELWEDGFEVGVHGLRHDGRDLSSAERVSAMRAYAERWGAEGFRSPATHRSWDLMPRLGFGYDSSYPDTDPFEPQPGGCCSWLPFTNDGLVELPITLPQDHTLFEILRHRNEGLWLEKTFALRARGGMALLLTHPDYMGAAGRLQAYGRFLRIFAEDESVWRALPVEVAAWWRRRAASRLERGQNGGWRVVGPAAEEGRVALVEAGDS
jgi:hypothetical protein